jgi:hypothetical protein
VKREWRREGHGQSVDRLEEVLRVAGRVVGGAARRDLDEGDVAAPGTQRRRDLLRPRAFGPQQARQNLRLLGDLARQEFTSHIPSQSLCGQRAAVSYQEIA